MTGLVSAASKPKCQTSRPPSKNTCTCQPEAISPNCVKKYLMQSKTLRVKCKGLLVSNFESCKLIHHEDDDPLAWKVTFHMHTFVLFNAFLEVQQRNFFWGDQVNIIFLPQPQITQVKAESQGSAFYSWFMQPAAVKQPLDKWLNAQHKNKQWYTLNLKWKSQDTCSFSSAQSEMRNM